MENLLFGTWLKKKRRALDITREELSERIGYSVRTVEKVESGERRPSREIAEVLSEVLGVPEAEQQAFVQFARAGLPLDSAGEVSAEDELSPWRLLRRRPNNLPPERTGFIGREPLIGDALRLLERTDVRLLTLTGPPGVGKTRLSLQLASRLLGSFRDGAFFVQLAPLSDPDLVAPAIARALSLREEADRPAAEQIARYLREKELLLVLDNFEQVSEAATLVSSLLDAASELKVLVSSREVLHLYGEYAFPVPPLALPGHHELASIERVAGCDSVRLFVERALAADPTFVLTTDNSAQVAEICIRLEGLPLAIELATARVRTLSLQEIVKRLESRMELLAGGPRDRPERQKALEAAIDWSYDLLSDEEQRIFRLLSLFVGGGSSEAVRRVCVLEEESICNDHLISLRDKSLIVLEESDSGYWFQMLETIREYALKRLRESSEAEEGRQRHAAFYLELAQTASRQITGPEGGAWLTRLEREHDNLRAALTTAIDTHDHATALGISSALWRFWHMRGYPREGLGWVRSALAIGAEAAVPLDVLNGAFTAAGNLAWAAGDYGLARRMHEQALEIARRLQDRQKISDALNNVGTVLQMQGEYGSAQILYEESLELCRGLDDKVGAASTLNNLGNVILSQGDYQGAVAAQKEALDLWRELGDQYGESVSLSIMGEAERAQGNYERAYKFYQKALNINRELGYKRGVAYTLHNIGYAALGLEKNEDAVGHFREGMAMCQELDFTEGVVKCLAGLATAFASLNASSAAELFAIVQQLMEVEKVHLDPQDLAEYKRGKAKAFAAVNTQEWDAALERSRNCDVKQAVAIATDMLP